MPESIAEERLEDESAGEAGSVYELIRDDIIWGRLKAEERLKVASLAERYRTSTNPVREALHQLSGEGFVVMTPNRGARVRAMDEDFVRDICEIEVLIEPALTRWFVGMAVDADVAELERIEAEIEANNFTDHARHLRLDTQFHRVMYGRHYNLHAADLWSKHREIMLALGQRYPVTLARRVAVIREHQELIAAVKAGDAEGAAAVVGRHVAGSGQHIIGHMQAARRDGERTRGGEAA